MDRDNGPAVPTGPRVTVPIRRRLDFPNGVSELSRPEMINLLLSARKEIAQRDAEIANLKSLCAR